MKKRNLLLATCTLLVTMTTPALAAEHNDTPKEKATGKHNFDQWQTIKRLQIQN